MHCESKTAFFGNVVRSNEKGRVDRGSMLGMGKMGTCGVGRYVWVYVWVESWLGAGGKCGGGTACRLRASTRRALRV